MDDHRTIAFDLFAMVCDDAIVRGETVNTTKVKKFFLKYVLVEGYN